MITISYIDLVLTVIAVCLVIITGAITFAAYRTARVMARYEEDVAPEVEALARHAQEFLDHLAEIADDLRGAARTARAGVDSATNGMGTGGQVDAALSLVRQLSALGFGIKSAVNAYQKNAP